MTAQILDGKAAAAEIRSAIAERVAVLATRGIVPGLGTVLVGDDPGSRAYVNGKHRDCAEVGIASIRRDLPADASQEQVEAVVDELNADPACTGYIRPRTRTGCIRSTSATWSSASAARCRARRARSWSCWAYTASRSRAPTSR